MQKRVIILNQTEAQARGDLSKSPSPASVHCVEWDGAKARDLDGACWCFSLAYVLGFTFFKPTCHVAVFFTFIGSPGIYFGSIQTLLY